MTVQKFDRNNPSVTCDGNEILIKGLGHPVCADQFAKHAVDLLYFKKKTKLVVNFTDIVGVYPNAAVPIAAVLEEMRLRGVEVEIKNPSKLGRFSSLISPKRASKEELQSTPDVNNIIWKFDSSDLYLLVTKVMDYIHENMTLEPGSHETMEWCFNEVCDNIFEHSDCAFGYFMVQYLSSTKRLIFCVSDTGNGIFNTLVGSKHGPRNPIDAITIALQKGISRFEDAGRGNGLYGLTECIRKNGGIFRITSSGNVFHYDGETTMTFKNIPVFSNDRPGTTVDFQVQIDKEFDIEKILNRSPTFVEMRVDKFLTPTGECVLNIKERSHGFGTRKSGMNVRNIALNLLKESGAKIVLDFSGVDMVSSSYADELIGKMVKEVGLLNFIRCFEIRHLSGSAQAIINSALNNRVR